MKPIADLMLCGVSYRPAWREALLTDPELRLVCKVLVAHRESAQRPNVSSTILQACVQGSGRYINSICAAMLSLGGPHAPIPQTMQLLKMERIHIEGTVKAILNDKLKVPGWGNSFVKLKPDPIWKEVDEHLKQHFNEWHEKIELVTGILHAHSKDVYANPSAYTAAASLALGIPDQVSFYLVIAGRLDAWTNLVLP